MIARLIAQRLLAHAEWNRISPPARCGLRRQRSVAGPLLFCAFYLKLPRSGLQEERSFRPARGFQRRYHGSMRQRCSGSGVQ
eukprot:1872818-Pyramimonas_sp.AAC.1